ncbi:hypothetical protein K440DRAFT_642417 [Wilcoxina mikolae CBS 423.85]|nr:hypothetical protein K440DRAFT_642417 [Wilcoxina mikolae CBS 423.85]
MSTPNHNSEEQLSDNPTIPHRFRQYYTSVTLMHFLRQTVQSTCNPSPNIPFDNQQYNVSFGAREPGTDVDMLSEDRNLLQNPAWLDVSTVVVPSEPSLAISKMSTGKDLPSIVLRKDVIERKATALGGWIISENISEGCTIYQSREGADEKRKSQSEINCNSLPVNERVRDYLPLAQCPKRIDE